MGTEGEREKRRYRKTFRCGMGCHASRPQEYDDLAGLAGAISSGLREEGERHSRRRTLKGALAKKKNKSRKRALGKFASVRVAAAGWASRVWALPLACHRVA